MRITPLERRALIRRLKNRLPLALRPTALGPRLAVVIVTNLWLAPEALAQFRANPANFTLVEQSRTGPEGDDRVKTYTKDELSQKSPANPTPDIGQVVQSQVSSLLQSMGQHQSMGKIMEVYNGAAAKNKSDFALYAAAMRDDRLSPQTEGDKLRGNLSTVAQNTATDRAMKSNELLSKIKTGFNFSLDIANIFSKKSKPQQGTVKYGLILQGISPDPNAPDRAAVGESVEEQMAYAGRAEVLWTIGPINEQSTKPFSDAVSASALQQTPKPSIWSRFKAPSGKFNAKVDPVAVDSLKNGPPAGIPGMAVTMTQEQGLYQIMYQTKANFEKDKVEHQVKAPISGELALGRRYNDNFEVIQTSAFNVLVDKRAPAVNIHYLNLEDRYTADLKASKNRHEFGAGVELPTGWKSEDKLGKNVGEKYKADYKFTF